MESAIVPIVFKSLVFMAMTCLVTACASPTLQDQPSSEFGTAGLYPVKSSGFAEAYVRRDAELSSYRKVNIADIDVSDIAIPSTAVAGTLRRDWLMTPEREAAMQETWAAAMDRAFSEYERTADGAGVMRITAQLIKLAPGRPTATTIGGELSPAGSSQDVVEIWAEFRLYDQFNDDLLAVIRDNRTMTSVAMSRTAPVAVTQLFSSWAALLHTRVSGK